jgi:hypothetical protein
LHQPIEFQLFAPTDCYVFQSNRWFMLIRWSKNQNSKIYIPRIITLHPPISYIKEILRDRERERKRKSKGRVEERKNKGKEKDRFETRLEAQK